MGVNLFQYKTLYTTQGIDNQLLKHASCHFDLQKKWFTIFCHYTFSAEKQVKSNYIHTWWRNACINIKNISIQVSPHNEMQEEQKKVQYIVNLFIQTPYPPDSVF